MCGLLISGWLRGWDVFCVGFLERPIWSNAYSHPSWTTANTLALLIFSPLYLFMNYLERGFYELTERDSTQRHLGEARLCLHKQNHVGELIGLFRASPLFLVLKKVCFCVPFFPPKLLSLTLHRDQTHRVGIWLTNLHILKKLTKVIDNVGSQGVDQTTHRIIFKTSITNI